MIRPLRFGLVGTGHWAQITHAPALASTGGIEFAAVWGRNSGTAGELAGRYHATAYDDISAFLADVDAVAFAVPAGCAGPDRRPRGQSGASTCCLKSPLRSPRRMGMPWPRGGAGRRRVRCVLHRPVPGRRAGLVVRDHGHRPVGWGVRGVAGLRPAGG
jgi:hypothetical protein